MSRGGRTGGTTPSTALTLSQSRKYGLSNTSAALVLGGRADGRTYQRKKWLGYKNTRPGISLEVRVVVGGGRTGGTTPLTAPTSS